MEYPSSGCIRIDTHMPRIEQLIQDPNVKECFATVYAPQKKTRKRFPDNCVIVHDSKEAAQTAADTSKHLHPAIVCGPSRSSEGFMLYYLIQWL